MKLKGQVTILFSDDGLKIEVMDDDASSCFLDITLNQEQTCQALSRLSHTDCELEVRGLQNVGKKSEHKDFEFELPDDWSKERENARKIVQDVCPEGWIPDVSFSSQNSFFQKDGKRYARTTIRRWVDKEK